MKMTSTGFPVRKERAGNVVIIDAGDYLNKLSGERIERECLDNLGKGCQALVISFRDTDLVNSIGVSILLGVIDAAQVSGAQLIFSDVNSHNAQLFEILGLTRYVTLAENLEVTLAKLRETSAATKASGH